MRFTILLFFIGLYACGQQTGSKKHKVDSKAIQLYDSATIIAMHTQEFDKAILFLDRATQIDSNYLNAYTTKLSFLLELNQFDKALTTALALNRIKPNVPDYYTTTGILYEIKGDTITSKTYFTEADSRYTKISDEMSPSNEGYEMLLMNKGINLILLGNQQKGKDILKQLYDNQKDKIFKEMLASYLNKSKNDILKLWLFPNNSISIEAEAK